MSDRIRIHSAPALPVSGIPKPPRRMAVELTIDEWHFVTSLVLNAAYIRAKPIVEAIERRAKELDDIEAREAIRAAEDRQRLPGLEEAARHSQLQAQQIPALQREIAELNQTAKRLRAELRDLRKKADGPKPNGNGGTIDDAAPDEALPS